MSRTIQEILAELEANRDEAQAQRKTKAEKVAKEETAIRDAIEAREAALKEDNQDAYDKATQNKSFHEAAVKRIKELPPYYTTEQIEAYHREGISAQLVTERKFAERIAPLIDQILQIEKEAMAEISKVNHIPRLVSETMSDNVNSKYIMPFFPVVFPKIPYEFYHSIFKLAGRE